MKDLILKKNLIIPAGTVFAAAPLKTERDMNWEKVKDKIVKSIKHFSETEDFVLTCMENMPKNDNKTHTLEYKLKQVLEIAERVQKQRG